MMRRRSVKPARCAQPKPTSCRVAGSDLPAQKCADDVGLSDACFASRIGSQSIAAGLLCDTLPKLNCIATHADCGIV